MTALNLPLLILHFYISQMILITIALIASGFVTVNYFRPSLIFVSKTGARSRDMNIGPVWNKLIRHCPMKSSLFLLLKTGVL